MRNHTVTLMLLVLLLHQSSAQILPFRTFTIHDGLPSNQIRAICQDARGHLWIGTYGGGVATFDGTTFRSRSVPSGIVWALAPSRSADDAVWLGTWGGLCRADTGGISLFLPEDSALSRTMFTVMEDRNGTVWCGTSNGVQILVPGARSPTPFYPDTTFGHVVKICQSSDGTIYIGSWEGLWSYQTSRGLRKLGERRPDQIHMVLALYLGRGDTLWVGRWDRMMLRYHRDVLMDSLLIPEGYVHQMAEDSSGDLWCASSQGIMRLRVKNLSRAALTWYRTEHGLPETAHRAVYVDTEANIWFGSAFKGLSRLSSVTTSSIPLSTLPDHPNFASCVPDRRGQYWVAASNGVWEIRPSSHQAWERYFHTLSSTQEGATFSPRCIDPRGNLWVSYERGMDVFAIERRNGPSKLTKLHTLSSGQDLPEGSVLRAHFDRRGTLWASIGGVGVISMSGAQHDASGARRKWDEVFPDRTVRTLLEDSRGRLWFGGTDAGLMVLEPSSKISHRLQAKDGLPSNRVWEIAEDPDGLIWVGCVGGVVAVTLDFPPRIVGSINMADGLLDPTVFALMPSPTGGLWIGTNQGLQCYRSDFQLRIEPSFLRTPIVAIGSMPDQSLWCLSYDAFHVFRPESTSLQVRPPNVHIVRCEVNDQTIPVPVRAQRPFSHTENNWTIEFGGINLRGDESLRYKYRLLPVDEEWHGPDVNRVVAFSALQPGTYTFEVVSLNAAGIQSVHPASLSFTIAPPFWRTWWFLTLIVGASLGLVAFGFRYRVNRLLAIERLRLRISSDLHDELASNLSSIALLGSIVQQGTAVHDEHRLIERMTALAQDSLASLRHIIWAIEPKGQTLEAFFTRLTETFTPMCRAQRITLTIGALSQHDRHVSLKPDQRQHLWLLLKEAITNAVKHARASTISLSAKTSGGMLHIGVADDGIGFDDAATSQGNGLRTMRMRAQLLRGALHITSARGKGTQLLLQIKN